MSLLLFFNRCIQFIKRYYRKAVFKKLTSCSHDQFSIVGDITVINKNISIGRGVTIYPGVMFFGDGKIAIGDNVDIGKDTIIYASKNGGGVSIGKNTMIAAQCYLIDMDHGIDKDKLICKQDNNVSPIVIGEDCWLGANVTVLMGSNIANGSVIGAKALVKGNTEPYSISVGIPSSVIRFRE